VAEPFENRLRQRGAAGPSEVSIAGLILAGGASRRMGTAKALLTLRGETFLDRLIRVIGESCDPVVVVLGHEPEKIRIGLRTPGRARFTINHDYERGQLTSLQCGLRAIPPESQAILFTPVDYPAIQLETIHALAAAFEAGGDLFVVPRYEGRHGHPVIFNVSVLPEFLGLPPDSDARAIIHRHRDHTRYIDVEDPGILKDVDRPEEYAELLKTSEQ
jgi:molybdenum cofactor cytidylyltransferase